MNRTVLGSLLLAAGVILVFIGVRASDSIGDRMSNFFTGSFTDSTMMYLIGGVILGIAGISLLATGRRSR